MSDHTDAPPIPAFEIPAAFQKVIGHLRGLESLATLGKVTLQPVVAWNISEALKAAIAAENEWTAERLRSVPRSSDSAEPTKHVAKKK